MKEEYKGTPKTRHQAKIFAESASPKVQKAWRRYNRMLQSDLSMIQILEKLEEMDKSYWTCEEKLLFDGLIDTQINFSIEF